MARKRRRNPTIEAAKLTLVGAIFSAITGFAGTVVTHEHFQEPAPKPAPVTVDCTAQLKRFKAYIGTDANKVTSLTTKGADGVAPLERDTGAKACGIDAEDLRAMVNRP